MRQLASKIETEFLITHCLSTFSFRESGLGDRVASEQAFFLDNRRHVNADGLFQHARTIAYVEPDGSVVMWSKIKDGSVVQERRTLLSRTMQLRVLEHLKPRRSGHGTGGTATPLDDDDSSTDYYSSCVVKLYYNKIESPEERVAGAFVAAGGGGWQAGGWGVCAMTALHAWLWVRVLACSRATIRTSLACDRVRLFMS